MTYDISSSCNNLLFSRHVVIKYQLYQTNYKLLNVLPKLFLDEEILRSPSTPEEETDVDQQRSLHYKRMLEEYYKPDYFHCKGTAHYYMQAREIKNQYSHIYIILYACALVQQCREVVRLLSHPKAQQLLADRCA